MEHESFEDETTARLMNEDFVCVKVDREERPDVDALYMEAVQTMTGRGGWPLNVFLTPEQLPFYGGTYFPPDPRHGMPAWTQVLQAIAEAWEANGAEMRAGGERLRERLSGGARLSPSAQPLIQEALRQPWRGLRESFDARNGGFGGAPKFPQASAIEFLLLARRARDGTADSARNGQWRHPRRCSAAASRATASTPLDGAPLREDALRQRAARPRLPARLAGFRGCGATRRLRGHPEWALREMRGPEGGSTARSTPTPRRRGALLRVARARAARAAR